MVETGGWIAVAKWPENGRSRRLAIRQRGCAGALRARWTRKSLSLYLVPTRLAQGFRFRPYPRELQGSELADSVLWLRIWLDNARITEEANFRRLVGQKRVGERLHPDIVSDIYMRVARWVGLPAKQVAQVSGHAIRIGATQDLLALNIDLASVMQAGRWKSTAMPMRYGEQVLAARGGMARAAAAQGRDGAD